MNECLLAGWQVGGLTCSIQNVGSWKQSRHESAESGLSARSSPAPARARARCIRMRDSADNLIFESAIWSVVDFEPSRAASCIRCWRLRKPRHVPQSAMCIHRLQRSPADSLRSMDSETIRAICLQFNIVMFRRISWMNPSDIPLSSTLRFRTEP